MSELVSIYVPTKNRRELLARAIRSIQEQDYPSFEIIIVDDASTDGTRDYLAELQAADSRVKVVNNGLSLGAPQSRNIGIRLASGRLVTGLDDDDEMLPHCIATLVGNFDPKWSFVCANARLIASGVKSVDKKDEGIIDLQRILYYNYVGNQVLTTKERWLAIGGFSAEMKAAQDYDAWVRLIMKYGPGYKLRKILYRVHEQSIDRISNSPNKIAGLGQFYEKYRLHMSPPQRAAQQFDLILIRKDKLSLGAMVSFLVNGRFTKPVRYYLSQFSVLKQLRNLLK